jgi:signal transduction histidine kinase
VRPMQVANSMKSRFLDLVSDQLRNPLNALQGLDLIDQGGPEDALGRARSNAVRMLQLRVDHIIAFSALQADEPLTCTNLTTLVDLGAEARRRIAFAFDASGTGLDIAPGTPDLPLGGIDAETLLQIVLLMLEIAMITSGTKNVALGTEMLRQGRRGTRVRITVTHDGTANAKSADPESYDRIGMASEIAAHMARRIGARLKMSRGRSLVLEVTLPRPATAS